MPFHSESTGISDAWWDLYTKTTSVAAVITCKPLLLSSCFLEDHMSTKRHQRGELGGLCAASPVVHC